jgi:carbon monoxide dehydrogenase subunit G
MRLEGQRHLPVDRATAWRALNDPDVLNATIPGCESIERTAENQYALTIAAALGPVRAKFRGRLRVEDIVAPESYTLRFEGEGGTAGFAKGSAKVKLTEERGATRLDYAVESQVGGRLAQVGNRLIDSAARKLAEEFFGALEERIAPPAAAAEREAPAPRPIARRLVVAAIVVAIVAAIAYIIARSAPLQ